MTSAGAGLPLGCRPPGREEWGWKALAFGLAFPSLLTLVYFVGLAEASRPLQQGVYLIGKSVQFGLPVAWLLRRHPGPWRLAWPSGRGALLGGAFGLAVLLAGLALYHGVLVPLRVLDGAPAAAIRAKVLGFGVTGPWRFLAVGAFYSVAHSAAEELYWRGFVFSALRNGRRPGWANLWSSAGFTAHHVILLSVFFGWGSPWTWALSLAVGVGGAFWAWLYQRSGSLLGPWLGHLLVDAAIFIIGWDLVR
jgi:membrane protease YdiL (CAAX protease family)